MKGIVFTELLEMAEETVGEEAMDAVLDDLALESGGAYTAVGTYPCRELVAIVGALSARTGLTGDALQRRFGAWMHHRFTELYPQFFADKTCPLAMLDAIETEVHVEVRKLYPEAELPTFATGRPGPDHLRMHYVSARPLAAFCHGLVEACVAHFETVATIRVDRRSHCEAVFDIRLEQ